MVTLNVQSFYQPPMGGVESIGQGVDLTLVGIALDDVNLDLTHA